MADLSVAKPRINASLFGRYQGKVVTLMGTAHNVSKLRSLCHDGFIAQ